MSMEVECTHCGGRMLVEEIAGIVACPHCDTHLEVPSSFDAAGRSSVLTEVPADAGEATQIGRRVDPPSGSVLQTSLPLEPSDHFPTSEPIDSDAANPDGSVFPAAASSDAVAPAIELPGEGLSAESVESINISQQPGTESSEEPSPSEDVLTIPDLEETSSPSMTADDDSVEASQSWLSAAEAVTHDSVPAETSFQFDTGIPEAQKEGQTPPVEGPIVPVSMGEGVSTSVPDHQKTGPAGSSAAASPGVSKFLFILVASYASAATLAIIILIINLLQARQHSLESLPDLKPPVHNGKTAFQLVPADAPMPPGHTLRLGQSQRFGSLRVTPLRVTRSPVEFVYFNDEPGHHRPPTLPTLKLWLRFENVSTDQTFAPLGRELVLTRVVGKRSPDQLRANNFVCRAADKRSNGRQILLFDLSQGSNWDLRDQNVDRVLQPGETLETYLACEAEGLEELTGELIWRVQFRKGYNRKSKRGVTTLIEVRFHSKEIQPDTTG